MRLSAIEKPKGLVVRFAYWMSRKRLGKVMTPLKVVFARIPKLIFAQWGVTRVLEGGLSIGYGLQFLVQHQVAAMNDCGFCVDIGRAMAVQHKLDLAKLEALPNYRTDARFSDRERAALAYVEEATRHKKVSNETFSTLRKHFNETEIAEITWVSAIENYFNLINLPLEIESDGLCVIAERRRAA